MRSCTPKLQVFAFLQPIHRSDVTSVGRSACGLGLAAFLPTLPKAIAAFKLTYLKEGYFIMSPIQKLQASLRASRAQWVADETPLSRLTPAEKARRLGAVVDRAALAAAMAPRAQVAVPRFDPAVDWRNRNGNYVTPVKDQGGCGSCTSFSVVGTVESMALIELKQSLDLSEADLHFCSRAYLQSLDVV